MFILVLITLCLFVTTVNCKTGVNLSVATTVNDWDCLVNQYNVSSAIIRGYRNIGAVDGNSVHTLITAHAYGVRNLGIYIIPCMQNAPYNVKHSITCPSVEQQVDDLILHLQDSQFIFKHDQDQIQDEADPELMRKQDSLLGTGTGQALPIVLNRIWLHIEDEIPSMYFDPTISNNQDLIARMIKQIESYDISVGIYTSKTYWTTIMGDINDYGQYPLWYRRYDGINSFDFFIPFADFTTVQIQQTGGDAGWCGLTQVDTHYLEDYNE